jgi:hypothetical protein
LLPNRSASQAALLAAGLIAVSVLQLRAQPAKPEPCQGLARRFRAVQSAVKQADHPDPSLVGEYANLKVEYCECLKKNDSALYKEICVDPFPNLEPPCETEFEAWQQALFGDPFGPKRIEEKRRKYCTCLLLIFGQEVPLDYAKRCLAPPPARPEVAHPRVSPTPIPDPCARAKLEWAERWRDWEADKSARNAERAKNSHEFYCQCLREEYPNGLPLTFAEICNYPAGLPPTPVEPPGVSSLAPQKPTVTPTPTPDPNAPPKESQPPAISIRVRERVERECHGGFWYVVHYATYYVVGPSTMVEIVEKVEKTNEPCSAADLPTRTPTPTPTPTPKG